MVLGPCRSRWDNHPDTGGGHVRTRSPSACEPRARGENQGPAQAARRVSTATALSHRGFLSSPICTSDRRSPGGNRCLQPRAIAFSTPGCCLVAVSPWVSPRYMRRPSLRSTVSPRAWPGLGNTTSETREGGVESAKTKEVGSRTRIFPGRGKGFFASVDSNTVVRVELSPLGTIR